MSRHPLVLPTIFVGGVIFGLGLGASHMARPEVVLDFLQLQDFGLVFVMGGAAAVSGLVFALGQWSDGRAPLTGRSFGRRVRSFDRNVIAGGTLFGVGWGLSGICPGAAFASLGTGNYPILIAIAGMFAGAYLQAHWRSNAEQPEPTHTSAD
jgi:uncharacterized membrane protein YedE/YeeE